MSKKNKRVVLTKEDLMKIEASKKHRLLKEQGALDGRFKPRVVESKKKYKKPKHKGRDYDDHSSVSVSLFKSF
jgi:hypothetical protein